MTDEKPCDRMDNRARSRALCHLARNHPDEYARLLHVERSRLGLDVDGRGLDTPLGSVPLFPVVEPNEFFAALATGKPFSVVIR